MMTMYSLARPWSAAPQSVTWRRNQLPGNGHRDIVAGVREMEGCLIVVAWTRPDLWRHLVQRHAWEPGVDVILDRRRHSMGKDASVDRRVALGIGKLLEEDGFALIPR